MAVEDPAITIPVLASLDLAETERFYHDALGFAVDRIDDYLIAKRDRMEIHFWLAADRIHPEHTSCYIRGGQISALYEEYRARGVPTLSDFAVRPWNMKEFYIRDPHGNLLRFGGAPEELDTH
ncbi:MAG: VOC family protein [Hyphomicrobium zavarzinii]|uniref:bleomycin resistance protein n=1 Tax=Hyphomicrobium zavarzinii TaxID=48292 RepID=UPI001A5B39FD|nr:VOC family protein [Hyphomicrobium zavarzinii]MBL8846829.1 VOC family protein [Hyphomicrobium zavarzinii]